MGSALGVIIVKKKLLGWGQHSTMDSVLMALGSILSASEKLIPGICSLDFAEIY